MRRTNINNIGSKWRGNTYAELGVRTIVYCGPVCDALGCTGEGAVSAAIFKLNEVGLLFTVMLDGGVVEVEMELGFEWLTLLGFLVESERQGAWETSGLSEFRNSVELMLMELGLEFGTELVSAMESLIPVLVALVEREVMFEPESWDIVLRCWNNRREWKN